MPETFSKIQMLRNVQIPSGSGWSGSGGLTTGDLYQDLGGFDDILAAESLAVRNADGHLGVFVTLRVRASVTDDMFFTYGYWQKTGSDIWQVAFAPITGLNLTAAMNNDGRLSIFSTDLVGNIQHAWQTKPSNGPWQAKSFGGLAKKVTATSAGGIINVFYIGMDDNIHHNWQQAPNSENWAYQKFSAQAKRVAAVTNHDGRIEVILIGLDDKIYSVSQITVGQQDQWRLAELVGQAKEICVIDNDDGRLEVVYIGLDSGIFHLWQTAPSAGPWAGNGLGGFARQLCLGKNADGRLEIFYTGVDDKLYHNWQVAKNGDWNGNDPRLDSGLGMRLPLYVAAVSDSNGRLEVFYPTMIPPRTDSDGPGNDDGGGGPMDPVPGGMEVEDPQ